MNKDFFQYQYRYDYFSSRVPALEHHTKELKAKPGVQILEIGSFEGLSAIWFLTEVLTGVEASLTCIDPWEPYVELVDHEQDVMKHHAEAHFDYNTRLACSKSGASLKKYKGRSDQILPRLLPESYDLIYVDGSHLAKDVLTDLVFAWRLLKMGGLMICDDYQHTRHLDPLWTPKMPIDHFLACFQHHYQLLQKNWLVVFKKVDGGAYFQTAPPVQTDNSPLF